MFISILLYDIHSSYCYRMYIYMHVYLYVNVFIYRHANHMFVWRSYMPPEFVGLLFSKNSCGVFGDPRHGHLHLGTTLPLAHVTKLPAEQRRKHRAVAVVAEKKYAAWRIPTTLKVARNTLVGCASPFCPRLAAGSTLRDYDYSGPYKVISHGYIPVPLLHIQVSE